MAVVSGFVTFGSISVSGTLTPSGSNRAAVAFFTIDSGQTVTSVTCGGNAMTLHGTFSTGYFGLQGFIYKLAAPALGAQTLQVVASGGLIALAAFAVTDAEQATILRASAGVTGSGTSATVNATSQSGEDVLDFIQVLNAGALTVGANQTERGTQGNDGNNSRNACSSETASGSSTTMSWSWTGSLSYHLVAVAVQAVPLPIITQQPNSINVPAGQTATFTAAATGTPTPTWQWERSTNGGGTWAPISGATSASYTTPATTVSGGSANSGDQYRGVATNASGSATTNAATLLVAAPSQASIGQFDPDLRLEAWFE